MIRPPDLALFSTYIPPKMKRKTEERGSLDANGLPESKKRVLSSEEAATRFRDGLFDPAEQQKYTEAYAKSTPYVLHSRICFDGMLLTRSWLVDICMGSYVP